MFEEISERGREEMKDNKLCKGRKTMDLKNIRLWEEDGKVTDAAKEAILTLEKSPFGKTIIAAQMAAVIKKRAGLDDKVCFQGRHLDPTREEIIKNPHTKIFLMWGDIDVVPFDTDKVIMELEKVIKEYKEIDPSSDVKFLLTIIKDRGDNNICKEYL